MKIQFKQFRPWGCGHYVLANLFDNQNYLEDIEAEVASFVNDMNKSIEKNNPGLWVSTVFRTCFEGEFDRAKDPVIFGVHVLNETIVENSFVPFIVAYENIFGIGHYVLACLNLKNGLIYIFNSLSEEIVKITPLELLQTYKVTEVLIFENDEIKFGIKRGATHSPVLCFDYNYFPHLKP